MGAMWLAKPYANHYSMKKGTLEFFHAIVMPSWKEVIQKKTGKRL